MKYVFVNDLYYFLKTNFKLFILYTLVRFIFPLFLALVLGTDFGLSSMRDLFLNNLGIKWLPFSSIEYMIYILNICFYSYLVMDVFSKDLKFGKEYLFMRCSINKWLLQKIIVIFLDTTILETLVLIPLGGLYISFGLKLTFIELFQILFFDICIKFILELITIILLLLCSKMSNLLIILIYSFSSLFYQIINKDITIPLFVDIYFNKPIYLLITFSVLIILIFKIRKKLFVLFERS